MKKTIKRLTILIVIFFIFVSRMPVKASNATSGHTAEEVGQQIANWSIKFYNEHRNQCYYTWEEPRRDAYKAPIDNTTRYGMDCVGWVSFAVHHATGLGGEEFTIFARPDGTHFPIGDNGFIEYQKNVDIYNEQDGLALGMRPGDILVQSTALKYEDETDSHVGIYVGNDTVIHSIKPAGLVSSTVSQFVNMAVVKKADYIVRVSEEAAKNADFEFVPGGSILPSGGGEEFEFNGLPTTVSYTKPGGLDWLFDQISQFFSFLVGLIINVIKYSILGYASLLQMFINSALEMTEQPLTVNSVNNVNTVEVSYVRPIEAYTGETNVEGQEEDNTSQTGDVENQGEEQKNYTIEDIIFNNIPILDVNIFTSTPGGKAIPADSIVYIVRQIISTWYVSFRNLAIMALAIIVIYLGIRIALSTIPEKTGQYKTALLSWVISLVLVFTIHYFMVIVINVNESIVDLFDNTNSQELSIYDTIQTRAIDPRMNIGIPATIMYIILMIYFLQFLWIYIKRYFTVMILIVIAPFICAKYAFDSAKGKRGTSLTSWMYDFTLNILLQSVHALLYTALMGIAIELAVSSVWGFIIALVFINFIAKSDEIFMNIFDFGRGEDVKNVNQRFSKSEMAGALFYYEVGKRGAKFVGGAIPKLATNVSKTARYVGSNVSYALHKDESYEIRSRREQRKVDLFNKKDEILNKGYKMLHFGEDSEKRQLKILARQSGEVGRIARKTLKKRNDLGKKRFTSKKDIVKNAVKSTVGMGLAMPLFVLSPKSGYVLMNRSYENYKKLVRPKWEGQGYKKKYHGKQKLAQFATLGIYGMAKNEKEAKEKQKKKEGEVTKTIAYIKKVDTYHQNAIDKWKELFQEDDQNDKKKADLIEEVKFAVLDSSNNSIKESINNFNNINARENINSSNIDEVLENTLSELGIKDRFSEDKIDKIRQEAKSTFNYGEQRYSEQVKTLAAGIHDAVIKFGIEDDNTRDLIEQFDNIEMINEEARKSVKTRIVDTERLIDNIRFE